MPTDRERRINALEALLAIERGQKPPTDCKTDVKWFQLEFVKVFIGDMPRGTYAALVGRQFKTLDDQAKTYGIPIAPNSPVNVIQVLLWFHDFVSTWGPKIRKKQLIDEESADRQRQIEDASLQQTLLKTQALQVELERKVGSTISSAEMEKVFSWYESELRKLGERLGKKHGAEAQFLFNSTLDRMAKFLQEDGIVSRHNQEGSDAEDN